MAKVRIISRKTKKIIERTFSEYINSGQVSYLKAGHLDILETMRKGVRFTDPLTGKQMLDCFSSAGSFNIGRGNPEILKALNDALKMVDMGNHGMVSPYKVALAQKLVELAPGDLNRVILTSGGGDGIDAAIKLARGATGRNDILSTVKAYHGHTGFALSANGKEHYRRYFEPLMPGFSFATFNDLESAIGLVSDKTAAIIVEPVQGEAGIFIADDEYLNGLRRLCDEIGALLIFDEVQTGFGRTGKMFACEHSGVVPDMLVLAKSIGGGIYPNGALIFRDIPVLDSFINKNTDFHPSTSGGSDLGCLVSLRVIEFIEKNRLWENASNMGKVLQSALNSLWEENRSIIKDVRGKGLMIGIEYIHEFMGPMMSEALAKNGVFAAYSGNAPQVMRFMIPLVAEPGDINELVKSIERALGMMKGLLPAALLLARVPLMLRLLNNERVQTVLFNIVRYFEETAGAFLKKNGKKRHEDGV